MGVLEINGDLPERGIAVGLLAVDGETTVHSQDVLNAGTLETLHCATPQGEVRLRRVFDRHGNVHPAQGVADVLNLKGVGRGAGADPQHVDAGFQSLFDVTGLGDLDAHLQSRFTLHFLQPGKPCAAHAFKGTRTRSGLPDPARKRTVPHPAAPWPWPDLLSRFCTAWPRDQGESIPIKQRNTATVRNVRDGVRIPLVCATKIPSMNKSTLFGMFAACALFASCDDGVTEVCDEGNKAVITVYNNSSARPT